LVGWRHTLVNRSLAITAFSYHVIIHAEAIRLRRSAEAVEEYHRYAIVAILVGQYGYWQNSAASPRLRHRILMFFSVIFEYHAE